MLEEEFGTMRELGSKREKNVGAGVHSALAETCLDFDFTMLRMTLSKRSFDGWINMKGSGFGQLRTGLFSVATKRARTASKSAHAPLENAASLYLFTFMVGLDSIDSIPTV